MQIRFLHRTEKTRKVNARRDERAEETNERTNESPSALGTGRNELSKLNVQMGWNPVILHRRTYSRIREKKITRELH